MATIRKAERERKDSAVRYRIMRYFTAKTGILTSNYFFANKELMTIVSENHKTNLEIMKILDFFVTILKRFDFLRIYF